MLSKKPNPEGLSKFHAKNKKQKTNFTRKNKGGRRKKTKKTRGGAIIDSINKLISAKISYGAPLLTLNEKQLILGSIIANLNDDILEIINNINKIVINYEKINLLGNGIPSTELDGMYDSPVDYDNDPRANEPPANHMLFADLVLKTIITRLYKELLNRRILYSENILINADDFRTTFLNMIENRVSCYIIRYYFIDSFGNQYIQFETTTEYVDFVKELLHNENIKKTNAAYGTMHKIENLPPYFEELYQALLHNGMIINPNQ